MKNIFATAFFSATVFFILLTISILAFYLFIGVSPAPGTKPLLNTFQCGFCIFATTLATKLGLSMSDDKDKKYKLAKLNHRNNDLSKRWFIDFYVFDTESQKLKRKQVFIPTEHKTAKERKDWATKNIKLINELLVEGYQVISTHQTTNNQKEITTPTQIIQEITFLESIKFAISTKVNTLRPRSEASYKSFLNVFEMWANESEIGSLALKEVKTKEIYSFLDWLRHTRNVSNYTHNNYLDFITTMFNVLINRELIEKNICPKKQDAYLEVDEGRNIAFTKEQQKILEDYLYKYDRGFYYFTRFMYHGFIRPTEILNMKPSWIRIHSRQIEIPGKISKNRKTQYVTITDKLLDTILEMKLLEIPNNDYVFSKDFKAGSTVWNRVRVSERHKAILERLKLYDGEITMYSWKHTGICRAVEANINVKALQLQARHSSLEQFDIYLKSLGLTKNETVENASW